jgi:hypothetical protein
MKPTRSRLVGVAAALSTIAVAAPVSTASAETAAPGVAGIPFAQGAFALGATVTGPVVITTAPSTFINSNTQISAGGNWSGPQVWP